MNLLRVGSCLRVFLGALVGVAVFPACGPPPPSVIGPGGAVTLPTPIPQPPSYPVGWAVAVNPDPLPVIKRAGTTVKVSVTAGGGSTTIAGVPLKIEILPGNDSGVSSYMDFGPNTTTGVGRIVGTTVTGQTGASGILQFTLKATSAGDDELRVTARPGSPQGWTGTFPYETSVP